MSPSLRGRGPDRPWPALLALLFLLAPSGTALGQAAGEVQLLFTYGSEKDQWLKEVTKAFHEKKVKTRSGKAIKVALAPMGSGQCITTLFEGKKKAHLTSPASQVWFSLAAGAVPRPGLGKISFTEKGRLVRSPVVLAMWQDMVKAAGWEKRAVGWNHLADLIEELAKDDKGWAAKGHKEWGLFKFAHTHPQLSNSGLQGVLAMGAARADTSGALTVADLKKEEIRSLMSEIQSSVLFYGESTGFLGNAMLARGPTKLSAVVLYESEVIRINKAGKRAEKLQAIYPVEGTFWSDHPVGIVRADWVSREHEEAAEKYVEFLLADAQQKLALKHGFRPGKGDAKTDASLGAPFVAANGVDAAQPKKVLETPKRDAVEELLKLWQNEQRGIRVVLAIDVSFSMKSFRKLEEARRAAVQLVNSLGDNSQLTLVAFNHEVRVVDRDVRLTASGKKTIIKRLEELKARGGTSLHDGVVKCLEVLATRMKGKKAMRAVVLLSDGLDRSSKTTREGMLAKLNGGDEVPAFYTVGYGRPGGDKDDPDPPDRALLKKIATQTGGRDYAASPDTINKVLNDISGFFGGKPQEGK